jgi:hypothetical protein
LEKSTEAACKYFKDAYAIFDNWTLAAASFNVGMGRLKKAIEKQGENSYYDLHLNKETARYIYRILAIKYILEHAEKFGFHFRKKDLYRMPQYKVVKVDSTINDLNAFAHSYGINLKILKDMNPWLISDKLVVTDSIGYEIKIPKERSLYAKLEKSGKTDTTAINSAVNDTLLPEKDVTLQQEQQ